MTTLTVKQFQDRYHRWETPLASIAREEATNLILIDEQGRTHKAIPQCFMGRWCLMLDTAVDLISQLYPSQGEIVDEGR